MRKLTIVLIFIMSISSFAHKQHMHQYIYGTFKEKEIILNGGYIPKTTKPDLSDNLSKQLFDAMEGVVFLNDSQIFEMDNFRKVYGSRPSIEVELEEHE